MVGAMTSVAMSSGRAAIIVAPDQQASSAQMPRAGLPITSWA